MSRAEEIDLTPVPPASRSRSDAFEPIATLTDESDPDATLSRTNSSSTLATSPLASSSSSIPSSAASSSPPSPTSRRYLFGLLLLLLVVCLWVGSSTLIQEIFNGLDYHQPFFLTYYSTTLFVLYLPLFYTRLWWRKHQATDLIARWIWKSERSRMREGRTLVNSGEPSSTSAENGTAAEAAAPPTVRPATPSTPGLVGHSAPSYDSNHRTTTTTRIEVQPNELDLEAPQQKMSLRSTAYLSFCLCPIWFLMNYFFNLSLNLTSIASSTILSTTSSLFVLAFSYVLDRDTKIHVQHIVGVLIAISGVVVISWRDGDEKDTAASAGASANKSTKHHLTGDIVATLGALFYGLYTVLLKLRIPNENLIEMQLVFGFLGLFNAILFWPGFFFLSAMKWEVFVLPPNNALLFLTLNGIFGTVISDFLWAKCVLLTSPLIASLGLALTMPLAIVVDTVFHQAEFTVLYLVGGAAVLIGFLLVNLVHSAELKQQEVQETMQHADEDLHHRTRTASHQGDGIDLPSLTLSSRDATSSSMQDVSLITPNETRSSSHAGEATSVTLLPPEVDFDAQFPPHEEDIDIADIDATDLIEFSSPDNDEFPRIPDAYV